MSGDVRGYQLATVLTLSLVGTSAFAHQADVDRLEAARMCAERAKTVEQNGIVEWFWRFHKLDDLSPANPKVNWSVRNHFNGERQRCFLAVRFELTESFTVRNPSAAPEKFTGVAGEAIFDA
jgi:hypothetical protein